MKKEEYSKLCDALAQLNIVTAAIDPRVNVEFKDPQGVVRALIQKAYKTIDGLLIEYQNKLDKHNEGCRYS